ncbi:hypothetical protein M434DRAFT_9009 [Hypoxylon sp. CO27-5]|nr:hypothetical protein M434DRAFT_9009 [Hypoxylon sp. CO27-5]
MTSSGVSRIFKSLQVTADNQTAVEKGTDLDTSDDFFTAVLEGRSDNAPPMARQCPLLDLSGWHRNISKLVSYTPTREHEGACNRSVMRRYAFPTASTTVSNSGFIVGLLIAGSTDNRDPCYRTNVYLVVYFYSNYQIVLSRRPYYMYMETAQLGRCSKLGSSTSTDNVFMACCCSQARAPRTCLSLEDKPDFLEPLQVARVKLSNCSSWGLL